ncbi:unnamed protein product [Brassica napus]|uniref:(rape) hypothetical protein n=1 Tax=Brassica napus TaxID=3708 RepID=A0A816WYX3_BRANA|nr:unnamed protein product [Brassica napus]
MSDVEMKEESSDTLSVKELDVVLPRYQPFNGYTSPFDFILPPYKQFHGSSKVCKPPPPQELIPVKEAEAELENLHLPSSEEEDFDAVLPLDLMISPSLDANLPLDLMVSPSMNPNSTPDYDFSNYPQFSAPCQVTYTPTPPGGHLVLSYNSRNDALYACGASALRQNWTSLLQSRKCNGTNFERSRSAVPEKKDCFHVITSRCRTLPPLPPEKEEKEESGFDILSLDELFKGNMPDWLPGDSKLHYYEMKESEVEQAKEWLLLYAELAWYTKKQTDPFMFEYGKPLELRKITVQTKEVVDSMKNVKLDNAVFYISFRTRCGVVCKVAYNGKKIKHEISEESDWYEIQVVLPVGSLVVKLFLQRGLLFLGLFNKRLTVVINLAVRDKHATFVGTLGLLTCMFGGGLCISSLPSGYQMLMLHEAEAIDTTSSTQATDIVVDGVMHMISEDDETMKKLDTYDDSENKADKSLWATEEIDRISALSQVLVSVSESILRDTLSWLIVFRKLQVLLN